MKPIQLSLSTFRTVVLNLFWITDLFWNRVESINAPAQKRALVTYNSNVLDFSGIYGFQIKILLIGNIENILIF